jgi:pyruvate kinase
MRRTKIVCTIGPVSNSKEQLLELARSGMSIARMNMSHGDHEWHAKTINTVKELNKEYGFNIGIMIDTKGPEIRSGDLKADIVLKKDDIFTLTVDSNNLNKPNTTSVSYPGFIEDIAVGDQVLVDSGMINLEVISKDTQNVVMKTLDGGVITSRRHLNILGKSASMPTITDKDWADINFGIQMEADFFALSFVKDAKGVQELKDYIANKNSFIKIISKMETTESVKNMQEIIEVSDGIMVARGDLGAELPIEDVPLIQDEMVELARSMNKPVIVATQLLESMMKNPTPTRAEVTDIANAVKSQADAIMLSGETAGGQYPIKAAQVMNQVASRIEESVIGAYPSMLDSEDLEMEIVLGGSIIANNIEAKAIIALTRRGYTAQLLSHCRSIAPVYAFTDSGVTARNLSLFWGVEARILPFEEKARKNIEKAIEILKADKIVAKGDLVVLVSDMLAGQDLIDTVQVVRI